MINLKEISLSFFYFFQSAYDFMIFLSEYLSKHNKYFSLSHPYWFAYFDKFSPNDTPSNYILFLGLPVRFFHKIGI